MAYSIQRVGGVSLVIGAGPGVGREIARGRAAGGSRVIVNDVAADRAEEVVADIRSNRGSAESALFDVADFDAVASSIAGIGPVDIRVNNAGTAGWQFNPFAGTSPEDWRRYIDVNLSGVMHCLEPCLPG